jgi:hypothetical protein
MLRAIDPLNPGEKHIRLLRGSSPINSTCRRGIWGWLERVYDPQKGGGHGDGGWLVVDLWPLVTWSLRQHKSTVGIAQI